jgi:peroxisomal membrane protein 4
MIAQRNLDGAEKKPHAFLAGLVGGYLVFGNDNNVNQQVTQHTVEKVYLCNLVYTHRLCCISFPE